MQCHVAELLNPIFLCVIMKEIVHASKYYETIANICPIFSAVIVFIVLQAFLQDLGRGQVTVAAFNELSTHLLHEYSTDDTRKIKEVTDKHNAAWNSINNRCARSKQHIVTR